MDKFIIIFIFNGQIEICMFSNTVKESDKEMKQSVIGIARVGYE